MLTRTPEAAPSPPDRRPRSAAGPLAAAAGVAAIVIGGVVISGIGGGTPPAGPAQEQVVAEPIDVERALYAVMDARSDEGFFYTRVQAVKRTATLWGSPTPAALAELEQAAANAGYDLVVEAVPPADTWRAQDEEALSAAAEEVRDRLGGATLATIKIEVPLRTLVVWRTLADPAVDDSLREIAASHGITLQLRTAPVSESAAAALESDLRAEPSLNGADFQVLGATATSSGVVVVVAGDLARARQALGSRDGVFAVQAQAGVAVPGTTG